MNAGRHQGAVKCCCNELQYGRLSIVRHVSVAFVHQVDLKTKEDKVVIDVVRSVKSGEKA